MKKFNNEPNQKVVDKDGQEHWISRSIAVAGVVFLIKNNEIYFLVNKRGPKAADFQGLWNLPCGYLDKNETCADAFKREVYEETGFDIDELILKDNKAIGYGFSMSQPFRVHDDPTTSNKQNVTMWFSVGLWIEEGDLPELTIENNEVVGEVSEAKWITEEEIDDYEFAFNHKERIKEFISENLFKMM